jgi:hypothetical protein
MPLFKVLCGVFLAPDRKVYKQGDTVEMDDEVRNRWPAHDFERLEVVKVAPPKVVPEKETPKAWSPKDPVEEPKKKENGKKSRR